MVLLAAFFFFMVLFCVFFLVFLGCSSSLGVFFEQVQNLCFILGVFGRYLKIGVLFGCFFLNIDFQCSFE